MTAPMNGYHALAGSRSCRSLAVGLAAPNVQVMAFVPRKGPPMPRTLMPADNFAFRNGADARIAPNGQAIVFQQTTRDLVNDRRRNALMLRVGDGDWQEITGSAGASLSGRVVLSATAAGKVRPDDSVFVFARAAEGPRMPLAVMRRQVKDLPFDFSLDDSMAMTPTLKVSGFPRVVVVARVSRSGLATPQKGDLEAASAAVVPGARGIKLELLNPVD